MKEFGVYKEDLNNRTSGEEKELAINPKILE